MTRYKCSDCGADFIMPKFVHYTNCRDPQMTLATCPDCASSEILCGISCPLCGRYAKRVYCEDCEKNLREQFHELLNCNFTPEEIKALNEIFDGKELE